MEQSFKNENTCDIFMNEIRMEDEPLQKPDKCKCPNKRKQKSKHKKKHERKVEKVACTKTILETKLQKCIMLNILLC
jgi:hypothetical protein